MDEVGVMSDEKELFSLTELAEDTGTSWRSYLSKAIRKGRDVFVRLKGKETLNVHMSKLTLNNLEEMNEFRTPDGYDFPEYVKKHEHYIAWTPYWLLPKTELEKLLRDMPLWEINSVTPPWVSIKNAEGIFEEKEITKLDRKDYTSYIEPVLIDENKLFLFKTTDEKDKIGVNGEVGGSIRAKGKRKPHTAFIVIAKTIMKIERGEAWKTLIDLAQDSRGQTEVVVLGWGKIYFRRVRLNPEQEILYSHEPINYDKAENCPEGVFLLKHKMFDKAWTTTAQLET